MSSRPNIPRPSKRLFPPCIYCGGIYYSYNECLYYPICKLCVIYDHDTNDHNWIISLQREINPRNPQHAFKKCEAYGRPNHTITDHYDIEWYKRGEAVQAKKAKVLKSTRTESSNANRSKTLTKRSNVVLEMTLHAQLKVMALSNVMFDEKRGTNSSTLTRSINHEKYTLVIVDEYSRNSTLVKLCDEKEISQNFSSPYTPKQNGVAERKNRTLIEAARTMLSRSVFSKQYWTEAVATACYTQNRSTIVKRHLKTPYEVFRKRIPNIRFLHVFGCPVYIHIHKDHLGKFDEKADDGYLLGYSLAIKISKPSVDNINIAESKRYPPDEYLHPYEPSQRYQTNSNDVSFIGPYECPELVVLETEVSSDQNDEIINDDHSELSNHTNDEQIIDSLLNTKDIQICEHLSSPNI
ncbi:retrovirus-related pol polyprotein from transposon TNT 1-94 [Tanacetum coccineum]